MQVIQQITYRLYKDNDIPGILSLWENHSGWGAITEQQFNDWYISTPVGRCMVIVAENEMEEIVGQLSLIPAIISIDGRELKALRLSAPIIHKDFRLPDLRNRDHPAFQIMKCAIENAGGMGYSIIYGLPAVGWMGLLNMFPLFGLPDIITYSFGCTAISLKDDKVWETVSDSNADVKIILSFDSSYDELWNEAAKSFPIKCGIVRHSWRLNWKNGHHLVFEVRKADQLVGYAAFRKKDGLLADILARNTEDLRTILFASLKSMHSGNVKRMPVSFEEIKLMVSSNIAPVLDHLNHRPVNFQFGFASYSLQPSINAGSILPENWYIMPDD